tara:strand:- start:365 stop:2128 length:1764 start_codon:yes stop_codon:yes gene_type:complete
MENFVVSARKYRPATFDTVVGQQSITHTLKNAIKNNHLAQAFLFCGPRGVGKTSCARILAKTINCINLNTEIKACNECESCEGFNNNYSFNIHELDAASNNGVDKIRELVDQVRFAPQLGKYNIYIIDEVHMLSQAAFNAFLKTLEEPPAHALFILATTEKHKIIPTILSRCQIFDFKRIQIADIADHLAYVAKNEGIEAEQEALHIIAQKADGALRDALSIFDQIISYCGDKLTYQAVIQNLNILDYDYYFRATDALYSSDIPSALNAFNEILNNGFDGHHFINGLGMHFRNLLVAKDANTLSLLEVGDSIKQRYLKQSQSWQQHHLLKALELCNKVDLNYRMSKNQRLLVEITLMQICGVKEDNTIVEKKTFVIKQKQSNEVKTANEKEIQEQKIVVTPTILSKVEENVEIDLPKTSKKAIKIVNFKDNIQKKTISINPHNEIEKHDEVKENSIVQKEKRNEQAFSQEDLNEKWVQYANEKENFGKYNLLSVLRDKNAILKENFVVCITLDNKVQEKVLKDEKTKLLRYLKTQLENDSISLTIEVTPLKEEEMKAYTAEDKFKKMVKKNPDLLNLKDKFDLEIDF